MSSNTGMNDTLTSAKRKEPDSSSPQDKSEKEEQQTQNAEGSLSVIQARMEKLEAKQEKVEAEKETIQAEKNLYEYFTAPDQFVPYKENQNFCNKFAPFREGKYDLLKIALDKFFNLDEQEQGAKLGELTKELNRLKDDSKRIEDELIQYRKMELKLLQNQVPQM